MVPTKVISCGHAEVIMPRTAVTVATARFPLPIEARDGQQLELNLTASSLYLGGNANLT